MKTLITGGTGTLGIELQRIAPPGHEILAPTRADLDITDSQHVIHWMEVNDPDLVIHCAAYTDVPGAETLEGYRKALEVNLAGTRNLFWALRRRQRYHAIEALGRLAEPARNSRFVHISTDYVYEGMFGNHDEDDSPLPFNRYGTSKMLAEREVDPSRNLIIRTSFKPNRPWPYPKAFDDVFTSADYVDVIAPMIWRAALSDVVGVLNIGTERKSVYDLARRRLRSVQPMSRAEVTGVTLPYDISLNLSRWHSEFGQRLS